MQCLNCYSGEMLKPQDLHPAYLQCPNCQAIELLYQPMDYQERIHALDYDVRKNEETGEEEYKPQIIATFGGYGSGKSKASLQEFFLRCMENPKGTGLVTAPTLQLLKRTTIKTLLNEIIPPPLVERYNKTDGEIHLSNGFVIFTIPSDDDEKLRSINAGLIHIEEASGINRSIYDQLLTRMRDPFVKNRAMFVCSNPELGWIKDILVDNDKRKDPKHPEHEDYNPYIYCFIWETALNKHLPADFIELNSKGKPDWWIRKYLKGSFEAAEGAVYPNFTTAIIDPYPVVEGKTDRFGIPLDWERISGMDHGLRNPTAVVFAAINPHEGSVIIYNEYYKPNTLVPQHAAALTPLFGEIPFGKLRFMKADPSIKNKTDPINGKSVLGLYSEYGLFFSPANNDIMAGILRVNSYIERGKLKIYNTCTNTVREHLRYKFPEISMDDDKNLDENPLKKDEHSCFVAGTLIETDQGLVPIEKIKLGDKIWTRCGYQSTYGVALTKRNADVCKVTFSNGTSFVATGNHPVFVEGKGMTSIDSLQYSDIIKVSEHWEDLKWKQNQLSGMEKHGNYTHTITTINAIDGIYIKKYGNIITEKSQKDSIFTILTGIPKTIISKIWNLWKHSNTVQCMEKLSQKQDSNISNTSDHLQKNGMVQMKVVNGIKLIGKNPLVSSWKRLKNGFVKIAEKLSKPMLIKPNFAPISVNQLGEETQEWTTKQENVSFVKKNLSQTNMQQNKHVPVHVVEVLSLEQKMDVYNISVENAHEYYANGILVSNCDATRYMMMALPDDPNLLKLVAYEPPKGYNRNRIVENEYGWDERMASEYEGSFMSYGY